MLQCLCGFGTATKPEETVLPLYAVLWRRTSSLSVADRTQNRDHLLNEGFICYFAKYHVIERKNILNFFNNVVDHALEFIKEKSLRELSLGVLPNILLISE